MPVLPQHLLAAIVLASGVGALVMCLLVLRYGFTPPDDAREGRRREMATRLGHAVAGACFAVAAILSVVLAARAQSGPGEHPRAAATGDDGRGSVLDARLADVAGRLAALESRVDAVESRVAPLDGRLTETRDRLGALAAALERAAPLEGRVQEVEARLGPMERRLEPSETTRATAAATRLERAEARMSAIESLVRRHADDLGRAASRLKQLEDRQASLPAAQAPASPTPAEKPGVAEPPPAAGRWIPAGSAPPRSAVLPSPTGPPSPPGITRPAAESPAVREPASPRAPAPVAPPPSPPGPASPRRPPSDAPIRSAPGPIHAAENRDTPDAPLGERLRDDWQTVRRGFADAGDDVRRALDSLRRNLRETFGR